MAAENIEDSQTLTITPEMSKSSQARAEKEAFENAAEVIADINLETEKQEDVDGSDQERPTL